MIEKFLHYITKNWTKEDWEGIPQDDLRYHISEFLEQKEIHSLSNSDLFELSFQFEEYMGW